MRIVTHTCSNTEIVCALGASDYLVGVDDHSDHPFDVVSKLPRIGPDLDIDIERVLALKPDWVITSLTVPGHERCVEKIRNAGLNYIVTRPHCLNDVMEDIRKIGDLVDKAEAADQWIDAFRARLRQPKPEHEPIPLAVEWWPKPVIVPGQYSWVNEMLLAAGGINPFAHYPKESLEITGEMAEQAGIAGVIMSWCGVSETKYRTHVVSRRPDWSEVPAIKNDHIHPISEAWLGRPGPRLIQGIDRLSQVVSRIRNQQV